jgi:uncharacterized membrane protein
MVLVMVVCRLIYCHLFLFEKLTNLGYCFSKQLRGGVMRKMKVILLGLSLMLTTNSYSDAALTARVPQFSNSQVDVWRTIIYPSAQQNLKPHRHEHDRVLVGLNDGVLKVTNDKGQSHLIKLHKDEAIFLTKDVPNEYHTDENISGHPIQVMVIELLG